MADKNLKKNHFLRHIQFCVSYFLILNYGKGRKKLGIRKEEHVFFC